MMITSFNETPLHIAAILGHVDFAREILRRKPELATELDSERYSPLHLASAEGNLEMVKELLKINSNVCCVADFDGRTPLHLAAIKGRIDVVKELIQARPEVIHVRADRGETILHLCVKYNRLEALKLLLLESARSDQEQLLNSKDDDGNTALHLAAAKKQTKGIKLLLDKNGIEVNVLNGSGVTALDILAQSSTRDMKDMDIGESLRAAGALRAKDIIILSSTMPVNNNYSTGAPITGSGNALFISSSRTNSSSEMQSPDEKYKWLKKMKNSLMVVSTVIATMSFQAVLSPPGGIWQDDPLSVGRTDSESYSPLHLASADGNLEMVKELLKINSNVCCITDSDGRTPLHLAAIKGRIDVMKELIQARPEVIHVRADSGETILHLCVKYNRLESLKLLLLESATSDQEQLLNSKDDDDNTPLHLAAAKKQTKKNGIYRLDEPVCFYVPVKQTG
ncbi:ankyrin repeat-containing protein At2g01680-like [Telopea speciosissima]|uniref:ankyrin repeat-containing protein At2g01680-like n=1 Tax=Telopea speciosissima TaxID=54955 RepID=UPI001CC5C07C|nr:ankyrin repeat-containing protein At2g01680-like [Telopea speciosissima]